MGIKNSFAVATKRKGELEDKCNVEDSDEGYHRRVKLKSPPWVAREADAFISQDRTIDEKHVSDYISGFLFTTDSCNFGQYTV